MRPSPHPRVRLALLALCGASLAAALIAIALAVSVTSPSRNLRPIVASVDAMYVPVYVSMTAAGLLILAAAVAMASARHGNRAVDLAAGATLLVVSILALAALGLVVTVKASTEGSMEATLAGSLRAYGPGNASVYKAWDDMQSNLACCGVRTNFAQDAYLQTPWYRIMREGNPLSAPKIPNSCCSAAVQTNPSQLAACSTTLPSLPAQNAFMNPTGCFEAMQAMTDTFTIRYIVLSVILFLASGAAFGAAVYHLVLVSRALQTSDEKYLRAPAKLAAKFGYANHAAAGSAAASNVSLSRASLASLPVASSTASRSGRSPAPSVYSISNSQRSIPTRLSPTSTISNGNKSNNNTNNNNNNNNKNNNGSHKSHRSSQASSPAQSQSNSGKTESFLPPKPVVLAAQPIRSSSRGRQLTPANKRATAPPANQRATSPVANGEAALPGFHQRASTLLANQRTASPAANQRTTSPPANQRATSPPANQRATSPPANHAETLPKANQIANPPAANQTSTLPAANQKSAHAPGIAVRQPAGGQQTLSVEGKRESHF